LWLCLVDELAASNRVLVGLVNDFRTFLAADVDRYEFEGPLI